MKIKTKSKENTPNMKKVPISQAFSSSDSENENSFEDFEEDKQISANNQEEDNISIAGESELSIKITKKPSKTQKPTKKTLPKPQKSSKKPCIIMNISGKFITLSKNNNIFP